ncbi:nitrilase family protein [Salinactinospora qingdaonensis]|uniref:Nitrilase family protein n=1 Tax=Salinactinospora qingdaonensis TaxID=702744 RepID=A0ABP7F6Q6_9ACTN
MARDVVTERSPNPPGAVTVAALQTEPVLGDNAGNLERALAMMEEAVASGARLLVLPEAAVSGYVFTGPEHARAHAEQVPGGPACRAWAELCARHGVWVVAGVIERAGDALYNSAVLLGPDGLVGRYRKVHLWNDEKRIYRPGDLGFPVYETELGRVAMLICYDLWFPESFRACALGGADVVCAPSNWVPVPEQPAGQVVMANLMCMTGAHSNKLAVAAAGRSGVERGQPFIGSSVIVGRDGWPLAGPASTEGTGVTLAELDLIATRPDPSAASFNDPLGDRRPEVYAAPR